MFPDGMWLFIGILTDEQLIVVYSWKYVHYAPVHSIELGLILDHANH